METMALMRAAALFALCAAVAGCEKKIESGDTGPLSFEVTASGGDFGSAASPIAFSHDPFSVSFDVQAIDRNGQMATWFSGPLKIRVAPFGSLADGQADTVQMVDGVVTGVSVALVDVHDVSNIWFESQGTDEERGNYATGLSPEITVADPTIRQVQEIETSSTLPTWETSALSGDFVKIDLDGRTAVVTGVFSDGCYVTDITEPGYAYSSIFIYNHSRPDVAVGDRVVTLAGTDDEFFGFTELSFPSWSADGTAEVPAPIVIDAALVDDSNTLEQYESALVEVDDALVCPVDENYTAYGQWVVLVDSAATCDGDTGKINIVSATGAPDFNPADHVGETLSIVRGNLRYHTAADPSWMIYVRSAEDIGAGAK